MARRTARKGLTIHAAGLSELLAVHRNTITNWLRDGMPVLRRRGRVVELDLGAALRWIRERDAATFKERLDQATSTPDLDKERKRKLAAEADLAEMSRDQKRGEQVLVSDVEARWAQMAVTIREAMLAVPGVAVQSGLIAAKQEADLDGLIRDALTSLGRRGGAAQNEAA